MNMPESEPGARPPLSPAELVAGLEDQMQVCSEAWRFVSVAKSVALEPDAIRVVCAEQMENEEEAPDHNREARRGQGGIEHYVKFYSDLIRSSISLGQGAATWVKYGTDQQQTVAANNVKKAKKEQEGVRSGTLEQSPIEVYAGDVYLSIFDTYTHALVAEEKFLEPVLEWVGASPNSIPMLLDWLESEDADPYGEHLPLVRALARLQFDPAINSFLDRHLDNMQTMPELMRTTFANALIGVALGDPEAEDAEGYDHDTDVSWTRFLPVLLRECGVEISPETLAAVLTKLPLEAWPISLNQRVDEEHQASIKRLRDQVKELLTPFARPDRYLVFEQPNRELFQPKAPKRSKGKPKAGGRTTRRANGSISKVTAELEPTTAITNAYVIAKTPNGEILVELDGTDDSATPAGMLLASKECLAYLRKYTSDDRITTDMRAIVESVCATPRGDGAVKIKPDTISLVIPGTGQRKNVPVWELNPKKRASLNQLGELATDTRIFYAVIGNGDGTESVALYRIRHKSETLKYRGNLEQ